MPMYRVKIVDTKRFHVLVFAPSQQYAEDKAQEAYTDYQSSEAEHIIELDEVVITATAEE